MTAKLQATVDETKADLAALESRLAETQVQAQSQAIELARQREQLAASEKFNRANADMQLANLARANDAAKAMQADLAAATTELETVRRKTDAEIERLKAELSGLHSRSAGELQKARDEAGDKVREFEAACEEARQQAGTAREEAAFLRGQLTAMEVERAELLKILETRAPTNATRKAIALNKNGRST